MASASIDWDVLKLEYIRAQPRIGCKRLAEKHGLSARTISGHASEHKWSAQRDEYWKRVQAKAREIVEQEDVDWRATEIKRLDRVIDALYGDIDVLTGRAKLIDLARLIKLKMLLLGEPDSRQEITGNLGVEHAGELDIGADNLAEILNVLADAGALKAAAEGAADAEDDALHSAHPDA